MKKVSICVPIYKTEKYIEKCVSSLFEQTYQNIEFIFIDDKSPDNSITILKRLIQTYHKENETIIISHEKNRGLAAARNSGVEASTGEFIMHVDSDDYLEKNAVELALKKQKETDSDIVTFGFIIEYPQYQMIETPPDFKNADDMCKKLISRQVNINLCGRLYKANLYKHHNIKAQEGADMGEDYQVSPILAYYAQKVTSLKIPLYHYNCKNINSYCSSFSEAKKIQSETSINILMDFFKDKPNFKEATEIGWLNIYITIAKNCTRNLSNYNKTRFFSVQKKAALIDKKYKKKIGLKERIVLSITSYYLCYSYINIMRIAKKIYYKIKNSKI